MPSFAPASASSRARTVARQCAALAFGIAALVPGVQAAGRVFYDGFETGNTSLWQQDDYRNRCQVVSASSDGQAGPLTGTKMVRCNSNGTVAWNDPANFETLKLPTDGYANELLVRVRIRFDRNHDATQGSAKKVLRMLFWDGTRYRDIYGGYTGGNGLNNATAYTDNGNIRQGITYWGDATGDRTAQTSAWHTVEYYFNQATGRVRVWHDKVLVRDDVYTLGPTKWSPLYITSNWEDAHDNTNHVYFDEIEVFTDSATGAVGSLSDATASAGSGGSSSTASTSLPAPQSLRFVTP